MKIKPFQRAEYFIGLNLFKKSLYYRILTHEIPYCSARLLSNRSRKFNLAERSLIRGLYFSSYKAYLCHLRGVHGEH